MVSGENVVSKIIKERAEIGQASIQVQAAGAISLELLNE